jgi:hypothetical protein
MRTRVHCLLGIIVSFVVFNASPSLAQGTAFTYQGRLSDGTNSANGVYDLQFTIYDTPIGFNTIAGPITNSAVNVSNGLFTVALDFGANPFTGAARYLDIAARTNGTGAFVTLSPRQKLTPAPYAMTAGALANVIANNQYNLSLYATVNGGEFNSAGGFGATVSGGIGNSGAGFYTSVGGGTANTNNGLAATIAGGQQNLSGGTFTTVGGGASNSVAGLSSTISGGVQNACNASYEFIGGGIQNTNNGFGGTIGGGNLNLASGIYATIAGGQVNAGGTYAAVGGGVFNSANGSYATVAGGHSNMAGGDSAVIGGGNQNFSSGANGVVGGGLMNVNSGYAATIAGGYANVNNGWNYATIGGGQQNSVLWHNTTIGGGVANTNGSHAGTIGGGEYNNIQFGANDGTISGGVGNIIGSNSVYSVISGGSANQIQSNANYATIGGGYVNTNSGSAATVGGGQYNVASIGGATVGGGEQNTASGIDGIVGGGSGNTASGSDSTVSGGAGNTASGYSGTVGGGVGNQATNLYSTVPGGLFNIAGGYISFAAGFQAEALHSGSFVWADSQDAVFASTASDQFSIRARGGVRLNTDTSVFFGNQTRQMLNLYNAAYGIGIQSLTEYFRTEPNGTFSWFKGGTHSDNQNDAGGGTELMRLTGTSLAVNTAINLNSSGGFDQSSAGNFSIDAPFKPGGRFTVLTSGNVGISNASPAHLLTVGNSVSPAYCDGGSWVNGSDRNAKEEFVAINPRDVLEKVSGLSITEWRYKAEAAGTEHLGPMAQDFHAAFGLNGKDDTHISTVDEGGVALAAIQGLNEKLEAGSRRSEDRIQKLETENAELKQRNESLEKRLNALEQIVINKKSTKEE